MRNFKFPCFLEKIYSNYIYISHKSKLNFIKNVELKFMGLNIIDKLNFNPVLNFTFLSTREYNSLSSQFFIKQDLFALLFLSKIQNNIKNTKLKLKYIEIIKNNKIKKFYKNDIDIIKFDKFNTKCFIIPLQKKYNNLHKINKLIVATNKVKKNKNIIIYKETNMAELHCIFNNMISIVDYKIKFYYIMGKKIKYANGFFY